MNKGPYQNDVITTSKNFEQPTTSMRVVINVILNNFMFLNILTTTTSMVDDVILIWSLRNYKVKSLLSYFKFFVLGRTSNKQYFLRTHEYFFGTRKKNCFFRYSECTGFFHEVRPSNHPDYF